MKKIGLIAIFFFFIVAPVHASVSLYFGEGSQTVADYTHSVSLYINTGGSAITAFQTIISLPTSALGYESILMADYPNPEYPVGAKPNCMHSLLPPEWGLANKSSPYATSTNLYLSCGFSNPGYTSLDSDGDKLATLTFYADEAGIGSMTFDESQTKFYWKGNVVSTGSLPSYSITVATSIESTPAPGEIPERATDSISENDLNFVEVGVNGTTGSTTTNRISQSTGNSAAGDLVVVEEDDAIPAPPDDLPPRSIPASLLDRLRGQEQTPEEQGQVLSAQSLRELLIPGKSDADKRVVWINLVSVLIFILILAILIWKFISIRRQTKLKSAHISALLESELATLESKMGGAIKDQALNQELSDSLAELKRDLKN